jgi:hypothetical protein
MALGHWAIMSILPEIYNYKGHTYCIQHIHGGYAVRRMSIASEAGGEEAAMNSQTKSSQAMNHTGYCIVADNWFTSISLVIALTALFYHYVGTLRSNRKGTDLDFTPAPGVKVKVTTYTHQLLPIHVLCTAYTQQIRCICTTYSRSYPSLPIHIFSEVTSR